MMKSKLKSLLLGTLAATALLVSSGASANDNDSNFYLGMNSNGGMTFGVTVGQPIMYQPMMQPLMMQPEVIMVPPTQYVRYHQHRNWRPVSRHYRPYYRPAPVVYYEPEPQYYHDDWQRHRAWQQGH